MFIELTDHLRCPEPHEEQYLVLLPEDVEHRIVRRGELGCPVCGRIFHLRDGAVEFAAAAAPRASAAPLDGAGLAALVGLGGPGGYMVLVGSAAGAAAELAAAVPGVALVLVNPPQALALPPDDPAFSVLRAATLPLKSRSMRAVVLGRGFGDAPPWIADAARVVLPGLRVVGEGGEPSDNGLELLATAGGWWVAARTSSA
jgi:uncharacterized protein YbaR (Trm112 family)